MDGDEELIAFLQRVAGYCLSGNTGEHALFFGHGGGANGKGVLVSTLTGILNDYATTAAMDTFVASHTDKHSTDLAGLRGARMVVCTETEEGRRWAESKMKAVTGGDKITARFMRQDFFEFMPKFKLFVTGNHKPRIRNVDEAMRRRMNLIPFDVTIPKERRDRNFAEKLKAEWPGILAWAIEGCLAWQRDGLRPPERVRMATDKYLADEDVMARWLDECTIEAPGEKTESTALWKSWKAWAESVGEYRGTQKVFSGNLEQRGYLRNRAGEGGRVVFHGLLLLDQGSYIDTSGKLY